MRVLIIGGTGLLGPHVVTGLVHAGHEVTTLNRSGRAYFCERALAGDRGVAEHLVAAMQTVRPELVIDMIPFTRVEAELLVPILGDVPLVAVSSCDVYSAFGRLHETEDAPFQACPIPEDGALRTALGPEGLAYDKLAVEQVYGALKNVTILRMPVLYGWPDTTRVLPWLDQMLGGAEVISMSADRAAFRVSRALHKNAAHAVVLAALRVRGRRIYNVAEPKAPTEQDWIKAIARHCGWQGELEITRWRSETPSPRQQLTVATDLIRAELGYSEIHDPDGGLGDTVAFHAYQKLGKPYRKLY